MQSSAEDWTLGFAEPAAAAQVCVGTSMFAEDGAAASAPEELAWSGRLVVLLVFECQLVAVVLVDFEPHLAAVEA